MAWACGNHRLPKSLLFCWFPESRPRCGDGLQDLKDISIAESKCYEEARRSRAGRRAMYQDGLANHSESRAAWQCVRWCVRFASGRSGGR